MQKPSVRYCQFYSAVDSFKDEIAADFVDIALHMNEMLVRKPSRSRGPEQTCLNAETASHLLTISQISIHFRRNLLDVVLGALPAIEESHLTEICFRILNHPLLENSQFAIDQLSAVAARIRNADDLIKLLSVAANLPDFAAQFHRQISDRLSWGFCKEMTPSSRMFLLPQFPQYSHFLNPVRHFLQPGQEPAIPEPIFNNPDSFQSLLSYSEIDSDFILPWMTSLITNPCWANTAANCVILQRVIVAAQIDPDTYRELLSRILRHERLAANLDSPETWWSPGGSCMQTWFRELSAQDRISILNQFPQYNKVLDPMQIFHQPGDSFIEEHIQYSSFFNWLISVLPSLNPDQLLPTAIRLIQTPFWDNSDIFDRLFQSIITQLEVASPSCDFTGLLTAILLNQKAVSNDNRGRIASPLRPLLHRLFDQLSGDQQKFICDKCPDYTHDFLVRLRPFRITQDGLESIRNYVTDECPLCLKGMLDENGEPVSVEGDDNVKLEICSLHFCDHFVHLDCFNKYKLYKGAGRCSVCRMDVRKLFYRCDSY